MAGTAKVVGEQKPRTSLFGVTPGMHAVVVEKDKGGDVDPIERLIERGYKVVTDENARRVRLEIPEKEFLVQEKAQHERSYKQELAAGVDGRIKMSAVVQNPVKIGHFAEEDVAESGITDDES